MRTPSAAILLAVFAALSPACAHRTALGTAPTGAPSPFERRLERAEALLNDRRYSAAMGELAEAERLDPASGEADARRALAFFRTDRFDDATRACASALTKSPEPLWILPTCWAASLVGDGFTPESRAKIQAEIDGRLASGVRSFDLLLAAHEGFHYLDDKERRFAVALELGERARGTGRAAEAAATLFEDILAAPDGERRRALAAAYVRDFPEGRSAFDAARILLREQEADAKDSDPWEAVRPVLQGTEEHRNLDAAVASWLVEKETGARHAVRLLERSIVLLDREGLSARPVRFTKEEWKQKLEGDRALYRYLLGRSRLQAGDREKAAEDLRAAVADATVGAGAHLYLGQMALDEGRGDEAVSRLRAAMEMSGRRKETEELLARALRERYGWTGEARRFFLDREGGSWFEDVTDRAGLGGVSAERAAWGDFDGDGFDDLLLDGARLFRNRGDGAFEEVTVRAGLTGDGPAPNGGIWGDFDNDGDLDLLVTSRAGNRLWQNSGDGRFVDITAHSLGTVVARQTEAAAWGDLDNDGYLDLYLANYERPGPILAMCVQDQVLRNGRDGTFTDVSAAAGVLSEEPMCGRGVTWTDFDGDGRQDIVVGNYRLDPNFLWHNRRDGTFEEAAQERGVRGRQVEGAFGHTIGVVSGDLNGDGNLDLYTSNLAHPRAIEFSNQSMLLLSTGAPGFRFEDRFSTSGIAFEETSADAALADVDGDGDLDLYVTSIYPGRLSHLYLNRGDGTFTDRTWLSGTRVQNGWGAAFADYDGDGAPDLLVASRDGVKLFHNRTEGARWLKVRIDDRSCNRRGIGARVTVRHGEQTQVREITAGRGTGSQDTMDVLFGLGTYGGAVDVEAKTLCGDTLSARIGPSEREAILRNPPPTSPRSSSRP